METKYYDDSKPGRYHCICVFCGALFMGDKRDTNGDGQAKGCGRGSADARAMKFTPLLMRGELVRETLADVKTETRRVINRQPPERESPASNPFNWSRVEKVGPWFHIMSDNPNGMFTVKCPYGVVGDRIWVKETHWRWGRWSRGVHRKTGKPCWNFKPLPPPTGNPVLFSEPSQPKKLSKWSERYTARWHKRPSLFMPLKLSRLTLEITNVKVERVKDITAAAVRAEGVHIPHTLVRSTQKFKPSDYWPVGWEKLKRLPGFGDQLLIAEYASLWDTINADRDAKYTWAKNPWVWVVQYRPHRILSV
jgi:hypothetical protein